jgi:FKBP-type peptidyl-prolyl cis-trans isomerase SlyD
MIDPDRGRTRSRRRIHAFPIDPSHHKPMNIFANTVVTLTFDLYDADNTLLESTDEPIVYLHGGFSAMPPKLEASLSHKKVGDVVSVTLEPADAFGEYDPDLVKLEPVESLPPDVEKGMMFEAYANEGDDEGQGIVYTVTDIAEGKAVLDGNHAWAASACVSNARSSMCVRQHPTRSGTVTHTGRKVITTTKRPTTHSRRRYGLLQQPHQLIQRGERIARCHRIGIEYGELRGDALCDP